MSLVCLCLPECDLGTSTKVTLALSLATAPQKESNVKFTYRLEFQSASFSSSSTVRLFEMLGTFYRANVRISGTCRRRRSPHENI